MACLLSSSGQHSAQWQLHQQSRQRLLAVPSLSAVPCRTVQPAKAVVARMREHNGQQQHCQRLSHSAVPSRTKCSRTTVSWGTWYAAITPGLCVGACGPVALSQALSSAPTFSLVTGGDPALSLAPCAAPEPYAEGEYTSAAAGATLASPAPAPPW